MPHFAGYLWLNRPHKKQKWKRVFTCLYSSPALTYLVWWVNKHETQIRGFVLLNDYDVVHYLANSICIKPVSIFSFTFFFCFYLTLKYYRTANVYRNSPEIRIPFKIPSFELPDGVFPRLIY